MIELSRRLSSEQKKIEQALGKVLQDIPQEIRPVSEYILYAQGKRLRPFLTILITRLLGEQSDKIYGLSACLEMIHAASLLHDDIIDNADTRRGQPTAHTRFGATSTVLGGDALLARAMSTVTSYESLPLIRCLAVMIEDTSNGQILEIRYKGCVTSLESYMQVIKDKTARMISCACELGTLWTDHNKAELAASFGLELGLAFQMVDDAIDFLPSQKTGKPEGGDLREGKFTPPLYFYYKSLPDSEQADFAAKFKAQNFNEAEISHIVSQVRKHGFDTQTRSMADVHLMAARQALSLLVAGNEHKIEARLLEKLLDYVRNREV